MSDETPTERNHVLLIVVGVLAALSLVIAALVIFSSGEAPAEKPEAKAPVRAGEQSLTAGRQDAPTKVVVYEDFGDPASRELEIASRDFLRIEAARGTAQVEYVPFAADDSYARGATAAWLAVLKSGTPRQALAFHDMLFDRQPAAGSTQEAPFASWATKAGIDDAALTEALARPDEEPVDTANQAVAEAGVSRAPVVLVDGRPLTAASPTELADKLQRLVLARD